MTTTTATRAAKTMTAGMSGAPEPTRALCGDCKGTGRRAGACQRCRGKGYTTVGRTNR